MDDQPKQAQTTPVGIYDSPKPARITDIELRAAALSLLWLVLSVVYLVVLPSDDVDAATRVRRAMTVLAIVLPIAMIWVAATAARAARSIRSENARLQLAIDGLRQSYVAQQQAKNTTPEAEIGDKLEELAKGVRRAEVLLVSLEDKFIVHGSPAQAPTAEAPQQPQPVAEDQPILQLGAPMNDVAIPLSHSDFITALNFPQTAEDEEGFKALRRAMKDRNAAQLIQAAEDVLTLLSQDGIYMDDLQPDKARPEIWRQFAEGVRGRAVAALGGIRDRSSLTLSAGRMKQDPIFRDAAHHFLRRFDKTFANFAEEASDAEISDLTDTRTARAFMLLGRVAGTFH